MTGGCGILQIGLMRLAAVVSTSDAVVLAAVSVPGEMAISLSMVIVWLLVHLRIGVCNRQLSRFARRSRIVGGQRPLFERLHPVIQPGGGGRQLPDLGGKHP